MGLSDLRGESSNNVLFVIRLKRQVYDNVKLKEMENIFIHINTKGEKEMKEHKRSSGFIRISPAVIIMACLWMVGLPFNTQAALQGSAGNTIIRNTVTVNYNNAVGTAQTAVTSTVDVTVNTVNAAPTILSVSPSPGNTDGTGATQTYTVTVRTNSNGPGSVSLSAADGSPVNITLSGTAPNVSTGSIFLGSSIFDPTNFPSMGAQNIANNGTITIAVPNDGGKPTDSAATGGATGDGIINALTAN